MNSLGLNSSSEIVLVADDIWSVAFHDSDTEEQFKAKINSVEELIHRHNDGAFRRLNLILDFTDGGAFSSSHRRELLALLTEHAKSLMLFAMKPHFRYRMALNLQLMTNPATRLFFTSSLDETLREIKQLTREDYEISEFVCAISDLNPRFAERWLEKKETITVGPYTLRIVEAEDSVIPREDGLEAGVKIGVIEGCCLFFRPSGYHDENSATYAHQRQDDIIEEFGLRRGDFFTIVDGSASDRMSVGARTKGRNYYQSNHKRIKKVFIAEGGIAAFLAKGVKLVAPDSFENVNIVDSIEDAIKEILVDRGWILSDANEEAPSTSRSALSRLFSFSGGEDLTEFKAAQKTHIDRLCDILGKFAWEQEPPNFDAIEMDDSAFEPLYRSLELVILDFFTVFQDLKKVSEERLKLEAHLRHSDKVLAVGTLAGGIAHDFNNILWVIQGNCERLLRRLEEESPHRHFVNEVLLSAARGKTLVDQILAFSRRRSLEKAPIQVADALQESIAFLKTTLPKTIQLVTVFQEGSEELCVFADQAQLHQVLVNLGTNAYHAVGEKGILTIGLESLDFEVGALQQHPHAKLGSHALLKITDSGCGISADNLSRIFDPFFTTKEVGKGTGLGLSTVHGIVTAAGGFIEVESSIGVGTSFSVYWPTVEQVPGFCRTPDDAPPGEHPGRPLLRSGQKPHRILLVDDEQPILSTVDGILRDFGFEVVTCNDPVAAKVLLLNDDVGYDLLISDQSMPNQSGVEMIKELRGEGVEVPAVILTGFSEAVSEDNFDEFGIQGYCSKPVSLAEMRSLLKKTLKL